MCPFDVIHTFATGIYGELDTRLLLIFLNNIAGNYINKQVILSDGQEATVVFINHSNLSKPMVKTASGEILNLMERKDIKIISIK
jgi:HD-GYP domain-containing protein (c-di-GMP phosphodiesterase class II)